VGSVYIDMTFSRTNSASSKRLMVFPIDRLIFGDPSVPGSVPPFGARPAGIGNTVAKRSLNPRAISRASSMWDS
jgi:hypothetical protein